MSASRQNRCFLFTSADDAHADWLSSEGKRLAITIERFNTEEFAGSWTVEYQLGSRPVIHRDNGQCLCLSPSDGVFYRRPKAPAYAKLEPTLADWCSEESARAWESVILSSDARFLFHPWKSRAASNKLRQLQAAEASGLRIPNTLVTNSQESLLRFQHLHGTLVYKTWKAMFVERDPSEGIYGIYTSRVPDSVISNKNAVALVPSLYQEEIPKLYEIRVTVVGSRLFSCRIESQNSGVANVDWRRFDFANTPHVRYQLAPEENEQILALMSALELNFGCIDLIRHPDGDLVFLEVNVNGQWLWIEELTGLEISAAILEWLAGL